QWLASSPLENFLTGNLLPCSVYLLLGSQQGVIKQGCDGHGTNSTWYRGDCGSFGCYFIEFNISHEPKPAFLCCICNPMNSHIDHYSALLDHVCGHKAGFSQRNN